VPPRLATSTCFGTRSTEPAHGDKVAATIAGTTFSTGLAADRVATGSWTSDQGFGGSTVAFRVGSVVVLVTGVSDRGDRARAVAKEIAALILARIDGKP